MSGNRIIKHINIVSGYFQSNQIKQNMRQLNKESRRCVKTEEIIANKGQAKSKKQRMIIAKNKRNDNKKKLAIMDQGI